MIFMVIWAASWQNKRNVMCTQRRLRSAWASAQSDQSSLSTWRNLGSLATHWAHSEDSDQTGWMPMLIWVFAGRTCHFVGFVMRRSYDFYNNSSGYTRPEEVYSESCPTAEVHGGENTRGLAKSWEETDCITRRATERFSTVKAAGLYRSERRNIWQKWGKYHKDPMFLHRQVLANCVDPDQTAHS